MHAVCIITMSLQYQETGEHLYDMKSKSHAKIQLTI